MSYFLKKSTLKKGLYLQIYESYYDADKGHGAHKAYEVLGYEKDLVKKGIENPIEYYQDVVDKLNDEAKFVKTSKTSSLIRETPYQYIGYFPLKIIMNSLKAEEIVTLLSQAMTDFDFNLYHLLEGLIYSHSISTSKEAINYQQAFKVLYGEYDIFTEEQILQTLDFIGPEITKFVDLFITYSQKKYKLELDLNCYLLPLKQLLGFDLILDSNRIPIDIITDKYDYFTEERKQTTIVLFDNLKIKEPLNGNYLIQKAEKDFTPAEKDWAFENNNSWLCVDKELFQYKTCIRNNEKWVIVNKDSTHKLFITSNLALEPTDIFDIYKDIKDILSLFNTITLPFDDYGKENILNGHLLICFVTSLLFRLIQVKVLNKKYSFKEIKELIKNLNIAKFNDNQYLNLAVATPLLLEFASTYSLPINKLYLTDTELKRLLNKKTLK